MTRTRAKALWSSPAGGLMGPVRMISSGHELTTDYDEKTLHELGFKDMQVTSWFNVLSAEI